MQHRTLHAARTGRGWTMERLAQEAQTTKGTISRLEAGLVTDPSHGLVCRLEAALRLRPGTLVFGERACEVTK